MSDEPVVHEGIYDNRFRRAMQRLVTLLIGCVFFAAGLIALFDARSSWTAASVLLGLGILIGWLALRFRTGVSSPRTVIIDGQYGTFLPDKSRPSRDTFASRGFRPLRNARVAGNTPGISRFGIFLTPSHIHILGRREIRVFGWEQVMTVTAHWIGGVDASTSRGIPTNWLTFGTSDGEIATSLDELSGDPRKFVSGIKYYLEHPAARPELATSAALKNF